MCVILFSYQPGSETPLILGANRDEFFARPSAPLAFWEDQPQVLAGRDLVAHGTWLGITRAGRFAAITNVREPHITVDNPRSRGELTRLFLVGNQTPEAYLESILPTQDRYAGFNLLVGDFSAGQNSLFYLSNRGAGIQVLVAGTYGLSNHLLDSPWPKVIEGKRKLNSKLQDAGIDHQRIRQILENPALAEDERLPNTGVDYEQEKALSAMFIALPDYGTRTSTVMTLNYGKIDVSEQNYLPSLNGKPLLSGEPAHFELMLPESQPYANRECRG